tara:strand:- start:1199 stop:1363 length:165 start_codon:yes stop_codon:yes gene_type:complete
MEEILMGVSLVGFSTMISVMIFNSRKNDSLIRNLCDRLARLEGQLQIHFMEDVK